MLPHEMIQLLAALLSQNSLEDFRLWVMILFHCLFFCDPKKELNFLLTTLYLQ